MSSRRYPDHTPRPLSTTTRIIPPSLQRELAESAPSKINWRKNGAALAATVALAGASAAVISGKVGISVAHESNAPAQDLPEVGAIENLPKAPKELASKPKHKLSKRAKHAVVRRTAERPPTPAIVTPPAPRVEEPAAVPTANPHSKPKTHKVHHDATINAGGTGGIPPEYDGPADSYFPPMKDGDPLPTGPAVGALEVQPGTSAGGTPSGATSATSGGAAYGGS